MTARIVKEVVITVVLIVGTYMLLGFAHAAYQGRSFHLAINQGAWIPLAAVVVGATLGAIARAGR